MPYPSERVGLQQEYYQQHQLTSPSFANSSLISCQGFSLSFSTEGGSHVIVSGLLRSNTLVNVKPKMCYCGNHNNEKFNWQNSRWSSQLPWAADALRRKMSCRKKSSRTPKKADDCAKNASNICSWHSLCIHCQTHDWGSPSTRLLC